MAVEISKSKYALKTSCVHYAYSHCKVLNSTQTGKLNCELCKCSFFETTEAFRKRQEKADERIREQLRTTRMLQDLKGK